MGIGSIEYQLSGKRCIAYISHAASKQTLTTLAQALHDTGLSQAAIPKVSYTEIVVANIPPNSPTSTADVGMFANVLLRRASNGELAGLLIHAPSMTMFETIANRGYRVKADKGAEIAQLYSACAGETYTFHEGWLQGSSLHGTLSPT
jgi:hypothetical protein